MSLSGAMPEQEESLHHGESPAYPHDTGHVLTACVL